MNLLDQLYPPPEVGTADYFAQFLDEPGGGETFSTTREPLKPTETTPASISFSKDELIETWKSQLKAGQMPTPDGGVQALTGVKMTKAGALKGKDAARKQASAKAHQYWDEIGGLEGLRQMTGVRKGGKSTTRRSQRQGPASSQRRSKS
jgi:hypothetical protein